MAKSSGDLKQDGESLWLCVVLKLKKILGSFDTKNRPMLGNSASESARFYGIHLKYLKNMKKWKGEGGLST